MRRPRQAPLILACFVALALIEWGADSTGGGGSRRPALPRPPAVPAGVPVDASAFAATACQTLPPTGKDNHTTVFLDAGHGGLDPGAQGTTTDGQTISEAELTLPVEMDAAALLRAAGFRVVVSRTGPTNVARLAPSDVSGQELSDQGVHDDVAARAQCANEGHAQLLVGIYFDAGISSANAGSVTGYDAVRPFAASNQAFAGLLQHDVLAAMNAQGWQIPDAGVVTDGNLGSASSAAAVHYGHLLLLGPAQAGFFDTPSQMPGALIEPVFITDPFEGSIAAGAHGQQVIAAGVAAAVEAWFPST